jgi:glycosyltransferase involved in cell wall biosynthesis
VADAPVPQRLTIVAPTSVRFDSRTWRIGSSLAARGHDVTVLARSEAGLPDDERDPAGYRVLRVPVSARAGLPRLLRPLAGLAGHRVGGRPSAPDRAGPPPHPAAPSRGFGIVGRIRRLPAAFGRLAAIALTVRSQRLAAIAVAPPADLVHAMAYMGIPVGLALGRRDGAPVVYDARDIYTEARNIARLPGPARRLFGWVERRWARGASRVMTVNRPYAEVMAQRFGTGLPVIVMNSWPASAVQSEPTRRLRDALGLGDEERIVLYHGGLFPDRGIEQLIAALGRLGPEVHLVLLGYGVLEPELRRQAMDPALGGRLHVLPAVPPAELLDWVASADIAAMPIQPSTLNHRLTTPNKLFEAMAAGVAVVASNLPGMAAIVEETGCGVTCDPADPMAIAGAIRAILELPDDARLAMRERALAAARGPYAWETQVDVLLAEYSRLTGRPW